MAQSVATQVLREVLSNAAMAVPWVRAWRINRPRAGAEFTQSQELLDRYAFQALRGIEATTGAVTGKEVLEFGPGDTLSAGLSLLAGGARTYTALDRFVPDYSRPEAKRWYRGVHAAWAEAFPGRPWPDELDPALFPEAYPERVQHVDGSVESAEPAERYDVVSSWQVGEHVLDIQTFCELTAAVLKPDGVAVHRVDFGAHSWSGHDDPLMFLRFPPALWKAMGANRGVPNRRRHHEFMDAWSAAGLTVECAEVSYFDATAIFFDKLHESFKAMPRASLLVKDVVYVCRPRQRSSVAHLRG